MKNFWRKISYGMNKVERGLMWSMIVMLVILFDCAVIYMLNMPDWVSLIAIVVFFVLFFKHSKKQMIIGNIVLFIVIAILGMIMQHGVDGSKQIVQTFYNETGYKILAYVLFAGFAYAIWKGIKK